MQSYHDYTIEDCLEFLIGLTNLPGKTWRDNVFKLYPENEKVLSSIGRQVFKGKALTEKQHELVKKLMLDWYQEQFSEVGIQIENIVDKIREPHREVDKSHWVRHVAKDKSDYIAIRFPFSNQVIDKINDLKRNTKDGGYHYDKHVHYFTFNEVNVYRVVGVALKFKDQFEIDSDIQEYYNSLVEYDMNKEKFIPGVYNYELKNVSQATYNLIEKEVGKPNANNISELYDKRRLYGLHYFDSVPTVDNILASKIYDRNSANVVVRSDVWNVNQIFESLRILNRFPMIILLNEETAYDELVSIYNALNGVMDNKDISVMFRLSNKKYGEFNQFIQTKRLNNSISENTKIVIANRKKITKPIINSSWRPVCMFNFGNSRLEGWLLNSYETQFDLKIHYAKQDSIISQYTKRGSGQYNTGVETI